MRSLVVDDAFSSRKKLQLILSRCGQCDIAVNGREALEACKIAFELSEPYDLLCLDISMPEMDGQEALKAIRALEREHEIPVGMGAKVIMTSSLSGRSVLEAFRGGCEAYLVKPVSARAFVAQLQKLGLMAEGLDESAA